MGFFSRWHKELKKIQAEDAQNEPARQEKRSVQQLAGRAGFCSKCHMNVYLNERGGCNSGHRPECISNIYEVSEEDVRRERIKFNERAKASEKKIWGTLAAIAIVVVLLAVCSSAGNTEKDDQSTSSSESTPVSSYDSNSVEDTTPATVVDLESSTEDDWIRMSQAQKISLATEFMDKYKGGQGFTPDALIARVDKNYQEKIGSHLVKDSMNFAYDNLTAIQHYEKKKTGIPQIALGMSKAQVQDIAGPPEDSQVLQSEYGTTEYWYYKLDGKQYQICFQDDACDAINQY